MSGYILVLLISLQCVTSSYGIWKEEVKCPVSCTCRLEHLSDMAVHRFTKEPSKSTELLFDELQQHNEVMYEDDLKEDSNPLIKAVTCLLQTDVNPKELINQLPYDVEALSIIQGYKAGNKTITFSDLQIFNDLKIVEMQGSENNANSSLICDLDAPLLSLKYLNLDNVQLRNSRKARVKFNNNNQQNNKDDDEDSEEDEIEQVVTFEYVEKLDANAHPLRIVTKRIRDEIVPYHKYKETVKDRTGTIVFSGCTNLILLRVFNCELRHVHWEQFEGLNNLQFLLLERNGIKFVPDFAFYGTPNLRSLSLSGNNLLNIQVTDLAGLLELEYLDLSHNNFSQLSELSFPPFPKLQLADFGNNPVSVVFPNTFEVMNTTDSLILGGKDTPLSLLSNSLVGLKALRKLTLENLHVPILKRDLLSGMPQLTELSMSGNVPEIEYDAFLETRQLETLVMSRCNVSNASMDAFIGLENLKYLDLSHNLLAYLPPGIFDRLPRLTELLLNNNRFTGLERGVLADLPAAKLIRLTENPWHCSCRMSEWKPMIVNKMKQQKLGHGNACDKGDLDAARCRGEEDGREKVQYVYDNRVAPRCETPKKFKNWSVFHVMRKQLRCREFRPKVKIVKTSFEKVYEHKKQVQSFPYVDKLAYSKKMMNETLMEKQRTIANDVLTDSVTAVPIASNDIMEEENADNVIQQNANVRETATAAKLTAKAQYKLQLKLRKKYKQTLN